jgi:hypothetical protein
MQTHLIQKQSTLPTICTQCNNQIPPHTLFYREEGVKHHLHSLIARQFCIDCYAQYGEKMLLTGKKDTK